MAWISLLVAGILEVVWAYSMKQSHGFTRLSPSVVTLVVMVASFALLAMAMRMLPLGTAYAVWTGIGAMGTAILGMALFDESRDALRLASICLIVGGVLGLKLTGGE